MPRDVFVLKIQRELCHPKCARKVPGLSRNGRQDRIFVPSCSDFFRIPLYSTLACLLRTQENAMGDPLRSITVGWFLYELSARSRSSDQASFSVSYNRRCFVSHLSCKAAQLLVRGVAKKSLAQKYAIGPEI